MEPAFADTFFFLALLSERDSAHEKAMGFTRASERALVTTAWVLTEVADGCAARGQGAAFVALMDTLRESPEVLVVPPTAGLFDAGVALFRERTDKRWTLTDCISFVVMDRQGITDALTGDHHFEQAGFRALLK